MDHKKLIDDEENLTQKNSDGMLKNTKTKEVPKWVSKVVNELLLRSCGQFTFFRKNSSKYPSVVPKILDPKTIDKKPALGAGGIVQKRQDFSQFYVQ